MNNKRKPSRNYLGTNGRRIPFKPVATNQSKEDVMEESISAGEVSTPKTVIAESVHEAVVNQQQVNAEVLLQEANTVPALNPPSNTAKEVIAGVVSNPELALVLLNKELNNPAHSKEEIEQIEAFTPVIERLVELSKQTQAETTTTTPSTESKENTMTTSTIANATSPAQTPAAKTEAELKAEQILQTAAGVKMAPAAKETSAWIPTVIAAGTAAVVAGYDMITNDDLSKGRIVGTVAAVVVAAGAQQLIQRYVSEDQGTGVNCAIGAGVGLLSGGASRFAVSAYNNADLPAEL